MKIPNADDVFGPAPTPKASGIPNADDVFGPSPTLKPARIQSADDVFGPSAKPAPIQKAAAPPVAIPSADDAFGKPTKPNYVADLFKPAAAPKPPPVVATPAAPPKPVAPPKFDPLKEIDAAEVVRRAGFGTITPEPPTEQDKALAAIARRVVNVSDAVGLTDTHNFSAVPEKKRLELEREQERKKQEEQTREKEMFARRYAQTWMQSPDQAARIAAIRRGVPAEDAAKYGTTNTSGNVVVGFPTPPREINPMFDPNLVARKKEQEESVRKEIEQYGDLSDVDRLTKERGVAYPTATRTLQTEAEPGWDYNPLAAAAGVANEAVRAVTGEPVLPPSESPAFNLGGRAVSVPLAIGGIVGRKTADVITRAQQAADRRNRYQWGTTDDPNTITDEALDDAVVDFGASVLTDMFGADPGEKPIGNTWTDESSFKPDPDSWFVEPVQALSEGIVRMPRELIDMALPVGHGVIGAYHALSKSIDPAATPEQIAEPIVDTALGLGKGIVRATAKLAADPKQLASEGLLNAILTAAPFVHGARKLLNVEAAEKAAADALWKSLAENADPDYAAALVTKNKLEAVKTTTQHKVNDANQRLERALAEKDQLIKSGRTPAPEELEVIDANIVKYADEKATHQATVQATQAALDEHINQFGQLIDDQGAIIDAANKAATKLRNSADGRRLLASIPTAVATLGASAIWDALEIGLKRAIERPDRAWLRQMFYTPEGRAAAIVAVSREVGKDAHSARAQLGAAMSAVPEKHHPTVLKAWSGEFQLEEGGYGAVGYNNPKSLFEYDGQNFVRTTMGKKWVAEKQAAVTAAENLMAQNAPGSTVFENARAARDRAAADVSGFDDFLHVSNQYAKPVVDVVRSLVPKAIKHGFITPEDALSFYARIESAVGDIDKKLDASIKAAINRHTTRAKSLAYQHAPSLKQVRSVAGKGVRQVENLSKYAQTRTAQRYKADIGDIARLVRKSDQAYSRAMKAATQAATDAVSPEAVKRASQAVEAELTQAERVFERRVNELFRTFMRQGRAVENMRTSALANKSGERVVKRGQRAIEAEGAQGADVIAAAEKERNSAVARRLLDEATEEATPVEAPVEFDPLAEMSAIEGKSATNQWADDLAEQLHEENRTAAEADLAKLVEMYGADSTEAYVGSVRAARAGLPKVNEAYQQRNALLTEAHQSFLRDTEADRAVLQPRRDALREINAADRFADQGKLTPTQQSLRAVEQRIAKIDNEHAARVTKAKVRIAEPEKLDAAIRAADEWRVRASKQPSETRQQLLDRLQRLEDNRKNLRPTRFGATKDFTAQEKAAARRISQRRNARDTKIAEANALLKELSPEDRAYIAAVDRVTAQFASRQKVIEKVVGKYRGDENIARLDRRAGQITERALDTLGKGVTKAEKALDLARQQSLDALDRIPTGAGLTAATAVEGEYLRRLREATSKHEAETNAARAEIARLTAEQAAAAAPVTPKSRKEVSAEKALAGLTAKRDAAVSKPGVSPAKKTRIENEYNKNASPLRATIASESAARLAKDQAAAQTSTTGHQAAIAAQNARIANAKKTWLAERKAAYEDAKKAHTTQSSASALFARKMLRDQERAASAKGAAQAEINQALDRANQRLAAETAFDEAVRQRSTDVLMKAGDKAASRVEAMRDRYIDRSSSALDREIQKLTDAAEVAKFAIRSEPIPMGLSATWMPQVHPPKLFKKATGRDKFKLEQKFGASAEELLAPTTELGVLMGNELRTGGMSMTQRAHDYGMSLDLRHPVQRVMDYIGEIEAYDLYEGVAKLVGKTDEQYAAIKAVEEARLNRLADRAGLTLPGDRADFMAKQASPESRYVKVPLQYKFAPGKFGGKGRGPLMYGELSGKWVPVDILAELEGMAELQKSMKTGLNQVFNTLKSFKTVHNLMTSTRNMMSGAMLLSQMAGFSLLNPKNYKHFLTALVDTMARTKPARYMEATKYGLQAGGYSRNEFGLDVLGDIHSGALEHGLAPIASFMKGALDIATGGAMYFTKGEHAARMKRNANMKRLAEFSDSTQDWYREWLAVEAAGGLPKAGERMQRGLDRMKEAWEQVKVLPGLVYAAQDDVLRLATMYQVMADNAHRWNDTLHQAETMRIRKAYVDHTDIPGWTHAIRMAHPLTGPKGVMPNSRLMFALFGSPFAAWGTSAAKMMSKWPSTQPVRSLILQHLHKTVSRNNLAMMGLTPEDADTIRATLAPWQRNDILVGEMLPEYGYDEEGNVRLANMNAAGGPANFEMLNPDPWATGAENIARGFAQVANVPFWGGVINALQGKDARTGRDVIGPGASVADYAASVASEIVNATSPAWVPSISDLFGADYNRYDRERIKGSPNWENWQAAEHGVPNRRGITMTPAEFAGGIMIGTRPYSVNAPATLADDVGRLIGEVDDAVAENWAEFHTGSKDVSAQHPTRYGTGPEADALRKAQRLALDGAAAVSRPRLEFALKTVTNMLAIPRYRKSEALSEARAGLEELLRPSPETMQQYRESGLSDGEAFYDLSRRILPKLKHILDKDRAQRLKRLEDVRKTFSAGGD